MLSSRTLIFINVLLSYINWFAVAVLAGQDKPLLALIPCVIVVSIHLLMSTEEKRSHELKVIISAAACGLLVELAFLNLGIIKYSANLHWPYTPPFFMVGLWAAFATMFTTSLYWLHSRFALSAVIGFLVSGPSYYAGEKLGALTLERPLYVSLLEIGSLWFFVFPLLLRLSQRSYAHASK